VKRKILVFDLDGVIVDKPPLIPKGLLEKLFRGNKSKLHYRFPKHKLEILIRKISHYYLFRPPIRENIKLIKKLSKDKRYFLYIVSGRYSFLEKETMIWLKKYGLNKLFKKIYLNLGDEQPHLIKEKRLKQLGFNFFVDDDKHIVDYLIKKCGQTICFYQKGKVRLRDLVTKI
jgi:FMN phosphatase YigB (HAD superfamily)